MFFVRPSPGLGLHVPDIPYFCRELVAALADEYTNRAIGEAEKGQLSLVLVTSEKVP